nr:acyl-CoA dehydrogenase family protein [Dietzia lutea]
MSDSYPDLADWRLQARQWLSERLPLRSSEIAQDSSRSDAVPIFHNLSFEQEAELIEAACAWQREKYEAGYGAIGMPTEFGGLGLPSPYLHAFAEEESRFLTPPSTELHGVTVGLIAPTIAALGNAQQRERFVAPMLRAQLLACQLFSEPAAGSDLAGLTTRAERDGDDWIVNGQKVWTSGAGFAHYGELIARTDPSVPKHRGLTAFMLAMDTPGVEVRPIRQMSGGSSFYEVFLTDVRIPDTDRLGEIGGGWKTALTTLGFERGNAGHRQVGGTFAQLLDLVGRCGRGQDPDTRRRLTDAWIETRVLELVGQRISNASVRGEAPGAVGSVRKLLWARNLSRYSEVATAALGSRLTADTGQWGTYSWGEHVLGAPGFHIAGGTDEVQRNIIGERVLGLPPEPRIDKDVPFNRVPRDH